MPTLEIGNLKPLPTLFKADMKSYILLHAVAMFFSIEIISKTGRWLNVRHPP